MIFRNATTADIPGIIGLLRLSLGDGSTEKSEAFWRWKHIDNPFGASPVLVAEADGIIVGVRAFMRWEWRDESRTYRALRAVDTATHPDYQGKGIFKRLTLQLIEESKEAGYDFIFNTPNEQSRPGYLKMGWEQLGKLPVRMAPVRPLAIVKSLAFGERIELLDIPQSGFEELNEPERLDWIKELRPTGWYTPPTVAFLRWRYADCPARQYNLMGDPDKYLIFYYGRQQSVGSELRLVHYLVKPGHESAARSALRQLHRRFNPAVFTSAPGPGLPAYFLPALPLGLILTFRALNQEEHPSLSDWKYAMGDLELF